MRKILELIHTLLKLAQWVPFIGTWRPIIIAVSAVLGSLLAIKCDPQASKEQPKTSPSTPEATPIRTPSPSPTPTPKPLPRIIIDKVLLVGKPFSVKYTGEYRNDVSLYADEYRLGFMGKDLDGTFVLNSVVLNTAGDRVISLRDKEGKTIVSAEIRIHESLGKN